MNILAPAAIESFGTAIAAAIGVSDQPSTSNMAATNENTDDWENVKYSLFSKSINAIRPSDVGDLESCDFEDLCL